MKKLLALLVLAASTASGTTLTPIQLLNPTGSTAGQAILSTGASTAPTWGNVSISTLTGVLPVANGGTNANAASGTALDNITGFASTGFLTRTGAGAYAFQSTTNGITLANLVQGAANTVLANASGSTANFAAFSMPSCSGATNALGWTSGTGFACNSAVNAATLGGATFASPGAIGSTTASSGKFTTLQATSTITPSSTSGIVGTATNDNANAGSFGEYASNSTTGTSLTTSTNANCTSVSLTAGDWDVTGLIDYRTQATTTVGAVFAGISTTSATLGAEGTFTDTLWPSTAQYTGGGTLRWAAPLVRVSLASTTTVYMIGQAAFGTSTTTCDGYIRARRVR